MMILLFLLQNNNSCIFLRNRKNAKKFAMIHISSNANHIHRLQILGLSNRLYYKIFTKGR